MRVTFRGVELQVTGRHVPAFRQTWLEPGEDEAFEVEAVRSKSGDDLTAMFTDELDAELCAACLAQYRDDEQGAAAEHADMARKERLEGLTA